MKPTKDIENELKSVAPSLVGLHKPEAKTAPDGYFTQFNAKLMQQIVTEENKAVAPILAQLNKPAAPPVSEVYFQQFADHLSAKIKAEEKQSVLNTSPSWQDTLNAFIDKKLSFLFRPQLTTAFAGTLSVLFVAAMFVTKVDQCTDFDCKMAALSTKELDKYWEENRAELAEYEEGVETDWQVNYENELQKLNDEELLQAINE
jgi:hypothetical protein